MQGNLTSEIKKLNEHLQQKPSSMLFARLADRYLALNEIEKAIDICQSGLRHHPDYSSAHFVLAKCYFARKQYDEAERRLKRVLRLEPTFLQAHKLYSDLMAEIGWTQSSHNSLRRIHEIDPLFPLTLEEAPTGAAVDSYAASPMTPSAPSALELDTVMDAYPVDADKVSEDLFEAPAAVSASPARAAASPDLEPESAMDFPDDDFEKEEARFSKILDDLFSPRMAEEERAQDETRSVIERAARSQEPPPLEPPFVKPEPVLPPPAPSLADRLSDRAAPARPVRIEAAPPVPPPLKEKPEPPRPAPPFSPPPPKPVREDPFAARLEDEKSFEAEEKEFSSFLSTLDDMDEADGPISFDSQLMNPSADSEIAEQTDESGLDFPADEMDTPINARSRTEKPKEKFVTPTLGEIYAAQGQYAKAISVFELLLKKNPENEWYKTKLEYLKKKNQEEKS
ncbi:tetratricopeptide repeat protein [bacterium]|nr:tetratricopeptide repeat protein [bacterium]